MRGWRSVGLVMAVAIGLLVLMPATGADRGEAALAGEREAGLDSGTAAVPFSFAAYANNVRNLFRWQLGVAQIQGSGTLLPDGSVRGSYVDTDYLTYFPTGSVRVELISGDLRDLPGDAVRLVLRGRVTSESGHVRPTGKKSCVAGTMFTITLTDNDARIANNGETRDFVETVPDPGQIAPDGDVSCRGHHHGWSNANNPNTEPTAGGHGGGHWADVEIGGRAPARFTAIGFGEDTDGDGNPDKKLGNSVKFGITTLYFAYNFAGMRDGRDWKYIWYRNGKVFYESPTGDWTYGRSGQGAWVSTFYTSGRPLDTGVWHVEILVQGRSVVQGTIEIVR